MSDKIELPVYPLRNSHVFLGAGHESNERKTWAVIALCGAMMLAEIVGGALFGSIALVADGTHMATHAGALFLAAVAYTYARRHAHDPSFAFGTGKVGDLAGYTSAIILAVIAFFILYEAVFRLFQPMPIHYAEAIPIASVGLIVNVASAWLLSGDTDDYHRHTDHGHHATRAMSRDNNFRAAFLHVLADAAVSVLVIAGLLLAWGFGWSFMDPLAGIAGALVIASWSFVLIRDSGAALIDRLTDEDMAAKVKNVLETDGDRIEDFHLWRLGPGHLGVIASLGTTSNRDAAHYHGRLCQFRSLSHVTIEVHRIT